MIFREALDSTVLVLYMHLANIMKYCLNTKHQAWPVVGLSDESSLIFSHSISENVF